MGRDCRFYRVLCGLGVGEWTRLLFFRDYERCRCRRWDETAVFLGLCAVSVPEMGRDCCFSGILCGLGAWEGTRLLYFRGFVRSRCWRWDETVAFPGFCAVSVLGMGRDCCFSGVSRCLGWAETAVFPGFYAVSVLEKGRDCRCRFKCVPRLVGGSLTVRFSAKTRLRYCRCIRGVRSGGMEAGPSGRDSGCGMFTFHGGKTDSKCRIARHL